MRRAGGSSAESARKAGACDAGMALATLLQRLVSAGGGGAPRKASDSCGHVPAWLRGAALEGALEPARCDVEQCRALAGTYGRVWGDGLRDGEGGAAEGDGREARWGALLVPSLDGGTGGQAVASADEAALGDVLVRRWLLPSVSMHAIAAADAAADAGRDRGVPEEWWGVGGGGWWGGGGDLSRSGAVCSGGGGVGVSAVGGVSVRLVGKMSCAQVCFEQARDSARTGARPRQMARARVRR